MSWWAVGISTAVSVAGTAYSAKQAGRASDAQVAAGDRALGETARQYDTGLVMNEPARAVGYGALSDLASVSGYAIPAYTPLDQILGAGYGATGYGSGGPAGYASQFGGGSGTLERMVGSKLAGPFGGLLGGGHNPYSADGGLLTVDGSSRTYGGTINLNTGEVVVNVPGQGYKDEALSKQATEALRAGTIPGGGAWSRFSEALSRVQAAGYKYTPPTEATTAGVKTPQAGVTGPGSMSRFIESPDYGFRREEGMRGIERTAAARGGPSSGNAIRGLSDFASSLASGEFANWWNRRASLAGFGQTAVADNVNAGQRYAATAGDIITGQGNARASGIVGAANAVNQGVNSVGNSLLWGRYMQTMPQMFPSVAPASSRYSTNGPWRTGYIGADLNG